MKKVLLLTSLLLALTVSVALAGGVNLAWGNLCFTEAGAGSAVMTFACNTNSGGGGTNNKVLTASFMLTNPMADMVGLELAIEGQSDLGALPDWWKLGVAPDCRAGKATFNSNYTGSESAICMDWTAGAGFNAPNYLWSGDLAHMTLGVAISNATPFSAQAGQEYYAGGVTILNSATIGTGSCTGCSSGMIFGLKTVTAAGLGGRRDDFQNVIPGGNQCVIWNGSNLPCQPPVPTRNTTWGQVKSLYR